MKPSNLYEVIRHGPTWFRRLGPYLLLPGLVLLALTFALAPNIWHALYASYEFCRTHLADLSFFRTLLMVGGFQIIGASIVLWVAFIREWRRLRLFSKTLARAECIIEEEEDPEVILVDDARPFAFCHGLRRPRVYYSDGLARLLDPTELRAVLLHEKAHARKRDPLKVFVAHVFAAAFWPVPLARTLRDRYLALLEVRADQEAAQTVSVRPVAGALVKLLQQAPAAPFQPAAVSHINPTEERVKWLLDPVRRPRIQLLPARHLVANALMAVSAALLTLGATSGTGILMAASPYCQVT
jgi:beta-lactamase regulating signal transducer with metallopeptidase domain